MGKRKKREKPKVSVTDREGVFTCHYLPSFHDVALLNYVQNISVNSSCNTGQVCLNLSITGYFLY